MFGVLQVACKWRRLDPGLSHEVVDYATKALCDVLEVTECGCEGTVNICRSQLSVLSLFQKPAFLSLCKRWIGFVRDDIKCKRRLDGSLG